MSKMVLRVAKSANGEGVTLQLDQDGKPLGHIIFDAPTAEKHIHDVARVRADLPDAVPPDLDPGARLEAVPDPAWRTYWDVESGFSVLVLRHPGLGWQTYVPPPKEARALGTLLVAQADALEAKGGAAES